MDDPRKWGTWLAPLLAAVAGWWVGLPIIVQTLGWTMLADTGLGILHAAYQRRWAWDKSYKGAIKKTAALILVLVAFRLQRHLGAALPVAEFVCGFFVCHFGGSALQNAGRIGLPIPPALKAALENMDSWGKKGGAVKGVRPATQPDAAKRKGESS